MKLSIIIPTLNEAKYINTLLDSIKEQTYKNYELIISDSKSEDQTVQIAKSYGAKIVEGGKPAVGRNNGAEIATGDFLLFLDADVKLPTNFLNKAINEIKKRFLDLATCDLIPLSDLRFDKLVYEISNLTVKLLQFTHTPHASGACIFVSKRLFNRIKGFNESLKQCEDHDFVKRASEFRKLRVLQDTHIEISTRRFEKDGRLPTIKTYAISELNNISKGLIPNKRKYEFAHYNNIKPKKFDRKLIELEAKLDELNELYQKNLNINMLNEHNSNEIKKLKESLKKILKSLTPI